MFMAVTHYPNETLAELHDAGLLFFGYYPHQVTGVEPRLTSSRLWDNTPQAYDQRRDRRLCQLLINIGE